MSDHMGFPGQQENGEPSVQERAASAVEHALQELKASNKRKRNVSDHHGADGKHSGSKRTSSSNNVNGNNHEANQLSNSLFSDSLRDSPNSHDFSALSQQLARHVAGVNQGLPDGSNPSSTAAAALAGIMPQLTVPQPTELSFASTASGTDRDQQLDSSFDIGGQNDGQNQHAQGTPYNLGSFQGGTAAQVQAARESSNGGGNKPPVGSEEWHKVRRDNHKEVERRRRETINEGINEIAKIVPGCEKNKGSILQRAVEYITQLKANESRNIDKWTLEKSLTDQVVVELSTSVDKLKGELGRVCREAERWRKACQNAGLEPKDDEDAIGTDDDGDT